jgi:DNA topoisomerase-1
MGKVQIAPELAGVDCEKCGKPMLIRLGKFGKFMACSGFPECRNTKPILRTVGVPCPLCHEGEVVVKKTRKGRPFYGCSRYPECDYSIWERPVPQPCPECGSLMTMSGRSHAKCTSCGTQIEYELPEDDHATTHIRIIPKTEEVPEAEPAAKAV